MSAVVDVLLMVIAIGLPLAFGIGLEWATRMDRSMWRHDGYCPTCDRLELDKDKR